MSTIASLMVNLGMRTAAFEKGANRARGGLRSLGDQAQAVQQRLARFGRTLMTVAGIGGLLYATKRSMESIDAMGKLSDRVGESTENLIRLGHAAGLAGVDQGQFNASLEIFARRLGEAKGGTGEAVKGLGMLNLSVAEMTRLSPAEAFLSVAQAISELPTQTEKAAAAYQLFGRQGQQLLNMLQQGAGGIREVMGQADALHKVYSRIDAASIEKANDAIKNVKDSIVGLINKLAIGLAPALTKVAKALTKFVGILGEIASGIRPNTASLILWIARLLVFIKIVPIIVRGIGTLVKAYKAWAIGQVTILALLGPGGWAKIAIGAVVAATAIIGIEAGFRGLASEIDVATDGAEKFASTANGIRDVGSALEDVGDDAVRTADIFTRLTEEFRKLPGYAPPAAVAEALTREDVTKAFMSDPVKYNQALTQWVDLVRAREVAEREAPGRAIQAFQASLGEKLAARPMTEFESGIAAIEEQFRELDAKMPNRILNAEEYIDLFGKIRYRPLGLPGAPESDLDRQLKMTRVQQFRETELPKLLAAQAALDAKERQARAVNMAADLMADLDFEVQRIQNAIGPDGLKLIELKNLGLAGDQIAKIEAKMAAVADAQEKADLMARGKNLAEQLRTPAEQLADELADIEKLFKAGAISAEIQERAIRAANTRLSGDTTPRGEGTPFTMQGTSRERMPYLGGRAAKGPNSVPSLLQELVLQAKRQNTNLRDLLRKSGVAT